MMRGYEVVALLVAVLVLASVLDESALPLYVSFLLAAIVTVGVCLLMGQAGQVSLGQGAFYACGAYTAGALATQGCPGIVALVAAKVMSIAQSSFYSRGAPVESLDEALVRLGLKRLTGIFLEASMRASVLQSDVFERPMERVIKHSTATAHIARGVCRALQQPPERAFICALLHDIGIAGSLGVLGALPRRQRPSNFESISQAIEVVHEEASAIIGEKWALPWGVQWVVGHHHNYMVEGRVSPLAALVCMCDWLAAEAGAPALGEANQEQAERAMDYFGFDQPARKQLLDKCTKIVEELG